MNIKDALDKLSAQEFVYMIYNRSSFVPYVCCDTDDTMLDYASLFFDEAAAKEKAEQLSKDGHPVAPMKIKKEAFQAMLTDTLYYGIDAIRFFDGDETVLVETGNMVRIDADAKDAKGHPFIMNPSAQISMIYLVQELCQGEEHIKADKESFQRIQTEVLANIANADFYIAFTKIPDAKDDSVNASAAGSIDSSKEATEGERFAPALLKDKAGKLMLPVFTDMNELKKAFRGSANQKIPYKGFKYRAIVGTMLTDGSKIEGIIINPAGVKLPLLSNAARALVKDPRFIQPSEDSAQK